MQHRDGIALQPKTDVYRCSQAHTVLGDGIDGLRHGLQPQIVQKQLIPRQKAAKALTSELTRIKHRTVAETLPKDAEGQPVRARRSPAENGAGCMAGSAPVLRAAAGTATIGAGL